MVLAMKRIRVLILEIWIAIPLDGILDSYFWNINDMKWIHSFIPQKD
jgi:hypothetical protein